MARSIFIAPAANVRGFRVLSGREILRVQRETDSRLGNSVHNMPRAEYVSELRATVVSLFGEVI